MVQDDQIPPGIPIPVRSIGNVDVAQVVDGTEYVLIEKSGQMFRALASNFGGEGGGSQNPNPALPPTDF